MRTWEWYYLIANDELWSVGRWIDLIEKKFVSDNCLERSGTENYLSRKDARFGKPTKELGKFRLRIVAKAKFRVLQFVADFMKIFDVLRNVQVRVEDILEAVRLRCMLNDLILLFTCKNGGLSSDFKIS